MADKTPGEQHAQAATTGAASTATPGAKPPAQQGKPAAKPQAQPQAQDKPSEAAAPPDEETPYRIAREPLFVGNPDAGVMPARAFNAGDRVPVELVDIHDWHEQTDLPEWATAPPATEPSSTSSEE